MAGIDYRLVRSAISIADVLARLDLWAVVTKQNIYQVAGDLCTKRIREVPWLPKPEQRRGTRTNQAWPGVLVCLLLASGCGKAPAPAAVAVEQPKVESDLGQTTLSGAAVRSLKLRSEPVRQLWVQEQVPLTGWVMARQGNEVTLTAPAAGYIRVPSNSGPGIPVTGLDVKHDQELYVLEPVLAPVEQIQLAALKRGVEGEWAKARASVIAAESELKRVRELHKDGLRGLQDVEQAQARLKHAQEDQAAADDKLRLFKGSGAEGLAQLKPFAIRAPRAGTVLSVHVSPGQYVAAAAPLITLADLSELWVRVPVPESDLPRIDRKRAAVAVLKASNGVNGPYRYAARPVALVPLVDTARHTADILYQLSPYPRDLLAREAARMLAAWASPPIEGLPALAPRLTPFPERTFFARDQMVTVLVPFEERRREYVVPYATLVFDAFANSWIYVDKTPTAEEEKGGTHVYERRRVELGPQVSAGVVVRHAFQEGERVVVSGAAALFSREFHKPPVGAGAAAPPVDDDD